MYEFNPTILIYKEDFYSLIRCESDVTEWTKSKLSYKLCKLDNNFNILTSNLCTFKINNEIFTTTTERDSIKKDRYCIEDIKIIKHSINDEIIGVANILIQQKPYRIFRVGLIKLNIDINRIELIKILEVDNMNDTEKNWLVFKHNNKFLVIYKLFPSCKIYELNITDFTMRNYKEFDTKYIINKYDYLLKNINHYYNNLYFTPSCILDNDNNGNYILIVKVRKSNNNYYYYNLILNFDNFYIDILPKLLFSGNKYYLNDLMIYNNNIIGCFGIEDKKYEIKYLNII